jgi:hypothetical protein
MSELLSVPMGNIRSQTYWHRYHCDHDKRLFRLCVLTLRTVFQRKYSVKQGISTFQLTHFLCNTSVVSIYFNRYSSLGRYITDYRRCWTLCRTYLDVHTLRRKHSYYTEPVDVGHLLFHSNVTKLIR